MINMRYYAKISYYNFFLLISHCLLADLRIVDGDTIVFKTKKIRLFGIDAPETNQYCFDKKKIKYSCGLNSTKELINKSSFF